MTDESRALPVATDGSPAVAVSVVLRALTVAALSTCVMAFLFTNVFFQGVSGGSSSIFSFIGFSGALLCALAVEGSLPAAGMYPTRRRAMVCSAILEVASLVVAAAACLATILPDPFWATSPSMELSQSCTGMAFGAAVGLLSFSFRLDPTTGVDPDPITNPATGSAADSPRRTAFRSGTFLRDGRIYYLAAACAAGPFAILAACLAGSPLIIGCLAVLAVGLICAFARILTPAALGKTARDQVGMDKSESAEGPETCPVAKTNRPPSRDSLDADLKLGALMFTAGFIVALAYNLYPLSTRYLPVGAPGTVSSLSFDVLWILLACLVACVLASLLGRRMASASAPFVIAMVLAFGAVYMALPFMRDSSLPFVLLMSFSLVIIGALLWSGSSAKRPGQDGGRRLGVLATAGMLCAAVLSLLMFELFWGAPLAKRPLHGGARRRHLHGVRTHPADLLGPRGVGRPWQWTDSGGGRMDRSEA